MGAEWFDPDGVRHSEPSARMDLVVRADGLRVERICQHGVGHPIGTTRPVHDRESWVWVHGCDGCCDKWRMGSEARMSEQWQKIETAPRGSGKDGPQDVRHPDYVRPPKVLLWFPGGDVSVAYWDWYYAEGGIGYEADGHLAWIEPVSGEQVTRHYAKPTHWMPLPDPPAGDGPTRE